MDIEATIAELVAVGTPANLILAKFVRHGVLDKFSDIQAECKAEALGPDDYIQALIHVTAAEIFSVGAGRLVPEHVIAYSLELGKALEMQMEAFDARS